MPVLALASVGSLTYATSRPLEDGDKKKSDSHKNSKLVHFAHDADIDTYLTSIRSFMLTPPRNGLFGASRVPSFHGVSRGAIPGYKEVEALGKDNSFASYVVGGMPSETVEAYKKYAQQNPTQGIVVPKYRVTTVHIMWEGFRRTAGQVQKSQIDLTNSINKVKSTMDNEGYETYSEEVKINGSPAWIMAKSVVASDKSCYSCHSNVKEGAPIGHVMAILSKKVPQYRVSNENR